MNMNVEVALALICMAFAGIALIEIRDRWRMSQIIKLRLSALKLNPDAICAECGCKQANHDYRKQDRVHRVISFGPMKYARD